MSAPLRFLGVAIIAYVGLRTASSALALEPLPAAASGRVQANAGGLATLPPGVPADMGPPPPAYPAYPGYYAAAAPAGAGAPPHYVMVPYPVPAAMPAGRARMPYYYPVPYPMSQPLAPSFASGMPPAPNAYAPMPTAASDGGAVPALDQWPAIGAAGPFSVPGMQRTPSWGRPGRDDGGEILAARPSRFSVDSWALVRPPREGLLSITDPAAGLNPGLATNGTLGGSQAGLRITWRPLNRVGVHLRASTALMPQGRRGQVMAGGEGSLGVSWQPLGNVPVRLLAERRQRLGPTLGGGRNAFAFLAEGGLYHRPLPYGFRLDAYAQGGVVGWNSRDLFADGALAATTPLLPRLSLGGGMWGGVQPGLSRFDAGPRVSYELSPRLRAHLDYRFRVAGQAQPPSGPALTLSGGF